MDNFEKMNMNKEIAPWVNSAAFNNYFTYSFVSRSAYFSMIAPEYHSFMNRFVKNWLWWYDGYVPYFHNDTQGIPSTRLAGSLVNKIARKVVGGRVMFKNVGRDSTDKSKLNPTLEFISNDWAPESGFETVVKRVTKYAAAAGTALVKLNRSSSGELWTEALRFDSFLPVVGANDKLLEVKCFLRYFTNLGVRSPREGERFQGYYVVEHRYFGDYTRVDGTVLRNVPVAEYVIHRQSGSITEGNYVNQSASERVPFRELPRSMRSTIGKEFPDIMFDGRVLLPFKDSLGCELVKWTDDVSNLPELPFGESFLAPIISHLMSWDYYSAAANTDMYLGRGRVVAPKYITNSGNGSYNSGFDGFLFTQWQTNNPEEQKPFPIQFDLRSSSWSEIRTRLIQDISINTGVNISTIASFLNDNTAARTAREISTEENETAEYVNDQRAIIEKPLNRILKLVSSYYGHSDTVVIKWSSAGLTNRYTLAEIISIGLREGFISQKRGVEMFNYDDDTVQVQEEYEAIKKEREAAEDGFGGNEGFENGNLNDLDGGMNGFGENAFGYAGAGAGAGSKPDTGGG